MARQFRAGNHQCAVYHVDDQGANHRSFKNCTTNRGHKNFMTIAEFKNKDSPNVPMWSDDLARIWNHIKRTVRVVASHTSHNRPDHYPNTHIPYPLRDYRGNSNYVRYGTGSLLEVTRVEITTACPCLDCRASKTETNSGARASEVQISVFLQIVTATHVVFDGQEAQSARFEFFYDSEDRKQVACVYGVGVIGIDCDRLDTDRCRVLCVTHDADLGMKLISISKEMAGLTSKCEKLSLPGTSGVLVSHPHGVSKRISFGEYTHLRSFVIHDLECPTRLKTGLEIRFSGDPEKTFIRKLRGLKQKSSDRLGHASGSEQHYDQRQTFTLLRDVIIRHPLRMYVEREITDLDNNPLTLDDRHFEDLWWTVPPGSKLIFDNDTTITSNTNSCTLPTNPDILKLEIYIKGSLFETPLVRTDDLHSSPVFKFQTKCFEYVGYNIGTCSGSSGGKIIDVRTVDLLSKSFSIVHFGSMGSTNWSGLSERQRLQYNHDGLMEKLTSRKTNQDRIHWDRFRINEWIQRRKPRKKSAVPKAVCYHSD